MLNQLSPLAEELGMKDQLQPIQKVLIEGNQSMQWIKKYNGGDTIEEIMKEQIDNMIKINTKDIIKYFSEFLLIKYLFLRRPHLHL